MVELLDDRGSTVLDLNPCRCPLPLFVVQPMHELNHPFHGDIYRENVYADPRIARCEVFHIDSCHEEMRIRARRDVCDSDDIMG